MLEEIYLGNINPNEKKFIRGTRFHRAMQTVGYNENKLTELLDGKEKRLFLDLVNAQGEINGATAVECFIEGLRLGARIAIEVMDKEDGCLVDIT